MLSPEKEQCLSGGQSVVAGPMRLSSRFSINPECWMMNESQIGKHRPGSTFHSVAVHVPPSGKSTECARLADDDDFGTSTFWTLLTMTIRNYSPMHWMPPLTTRNHNLLTAVVCRLLTILSHHSTFPMHSVVLGQKGIMMTVSTYRCFLWKTRYRFNSFRLWRGCDVQWLRMMRW